MSINDLTIGEVTTITLVARQCTARETKNKKPYLNLQLFDGYNTISGNYWDWKSGNVPPPNTILAVTGQVTEWQGNKQLNISSIKVDKEASLYDFMPRSGYSIPTIYGDTMLLIETIKDTSLRKLCKEIFIALKEKWLTVPGAVTVHHAYVAGTLIHSYSVARIAERMSSVIDMASKDFCIAGALLHDIGKLFTYTMNGVIIDYTAEGQLFEHIYIGSEFVSNFADNILNTDDPAIMHKIYVLKHIILSHHESLDFGSPVVPKCVEAFIVASADRIDAAVEQIRAAGEDNENKWLDKIWSLNNAKIMHPNYVEDILNAQPAEVHKEPHLTINDQELPR